ncbi:MAG: DUF6159 family protein [Pseudomonadota bacterium]
MMEKLRRAWSIAIMCWNVLKLDKELIAFPILSVLACGLILASVAGPLWASGQLFGIMELAAGASEQGLSIAMFAIDFTIYFVAYFVMIFFNAGLIACARIRFAGGDPTVMDGVRASVALLPQIFLWALVTSIVGFLLSRIAEKQESFIGKLVFGALGAGWAIASFFAVPALVAEKIGPIEALKRSVSVIRKTWGEVLISEVGMSVLSGLIIFPAFLVGFAAVALLEVSPAVSISLFVLIVLWVFTTALIFSTLSTILKTALYIYATEGKIPDQFDPDVIKNPFGKKDQAA